MAGWKAHGSRTNHWAFPDSMLAMAQTALISGASGLVGQAVVTALKTEGWMVKRLVRRMSFSPEEISWAPERGVDAVALEGLDAVIHLAGEPVFGVWTGEKKERIRRSRVEPTAALSRALAHCEQKPKVMISASAVGYYGDRGNEVLTEDSPPGKGFLPETCVEWEHATRPAQEAGIRVVHLRTGIVMSAKGGALKRMLPAFKLGIAGRLGSGKQFFPWVTRGDVVAIIRHAIASEHLSGPVNVAAPQPVTNAEFTKTLAKVLHRPAVFPVPALLLKMAPGRMAQEAILASAKVVPQKLTESGYTFQDPQLEAALKKELGK
jgi:uncharacterized protein